MDDHDRICFNWLKVIVFFFLLTVIGLWQGCRDVKFAVSGVEAEAEFMKFSEIYSSRRRRPSTLKNLRYSFLDRDNKKCIGYDKVDLDWFPENESLVIEYLPGKLELDDKNTVSRLKGSGGFGGILLLIFGFAGTAVSGFFAYKYLQES